MGLMHRLHGIYIQLISIPNFDAGKDSEAPVHVHQPKGSPVSHADPDSAISNGENHSKFVGSDQPSKRHHAYYQIQFGY